MTTTLPASKLIKGDVVQLIGDKTATVAEVARVSAWVFVRLTVNDAGNKLIEKRWLPDHEVVLARTAK